jgi:hypothetical protein
MVFEELIAVLVVKYLAFYGIERFITLFTIARHWPLL